MSSFQLVGLDPRPFEAWFALSDAALAARGIERRFADEAPGYPCRVSLEDAILGDEVLLFPFEHQPAASPYRASGPIFVRRHARQRVLDAGEIPPYVTRRLMSVRGYDARHAIIEAEVCDGVLVGAEIERQFANDDVAYIQLHNARRGCFSCQVNRA